MARYPDLPGVRDFHDQYRHANRQATLSEDDPRSAHITSIPNVPSGLAVVSSRGRPPAACAMQRGMVNQVQVSRPPAVPLGDKFACIALGHPVRHELPGEIALPSGVRIYTAAPFDVGEDWLRSLGTLQAETLARSELVLLKTMPSANPAVVDHENEKLRRDVVN